ncbi:MAG: carboxypeptidase-like regulatory domain-containing protein [Bacteroidota bacterium]
MSQLFAQQDNDLVQFAGVVVSADSSSVLPLISIRIKGTKKGTYSDASGFFSFVARKSDTIIFSSIAKRTVEFVIPTNLSGTKYSVIQPMYDDTIYLPETVIRPWPTPEEFNYYFVKANIPDEYFTRASGNLRSKVLQSMGAGMAMDAQEATAYAQQAQAYQYYYQGQLPPQRLFDPIAWSQFFNAWKKGDLKKK